MVRCFIITIFIFMMCILNISGCGARPYFTVEPQKLAGTYIGTSENGEQITLTLRKEKNTIVGDGIYGGKEFAFIEDSTKKVTGKMILSDGMTQSASIETSVDGKAILEFEGFSIPLNTSKTTVTAKSGSFSGYYETKELASFMNAINLIQFGKVISGNEIVLQQNVLISGWLQSEKSFIGYAILPDETHIQFEASLDGNNKLIVEGIGKPSTFHRKDR